MMGPGGCLGQNVRAQVAHLSALCMVLTVIIRGVKKPWRKGKQGVGQGSNWSAVWSYWDSLIVYFILIGVSSFSCSVLWLPSTNHVLKLVNSLDHGSLSRNFVRTHVTWPGPASILECCSEFMLDLVGWSQKGFPKSLCECSEFSPQGMEACCLS